MPDSIDTEMRFTPNDIRILQALRAGPMQSDELSERMVGKYALAPLINRGFIENTSMGWRITEAGRAACPTRRSTERPDAGIRTPLQTEHAKANKAATIAMSDAFKVVKQLGITPPIHEKTQETAMTQTTATKPKALTILEYIEAHPGCSNLEIAEGTGITAAQAYLKYHIKNEKVIIMDNGLKNTFKLADGLTADSIYFNTERKPRTNRHEPVKDEYAAADSVDEKLGDFAQTMQEISKENAAADEPQKLEAKILKLDLPQRCAAEFCIKTLLKLMPHSHVITIRKARDGGGIAEIDGRTLAEQIVPDIAEIDVTLSALNTINQAMPS